MRSGWGGGCPHLVWWSLCHSTAPRVTRHERMCEPGYQYPWSSTSVASQYQREAYNLLYGHPLLGGQMMITANCGENL